MTLIYLTAFLFLGFPTPLNAAPLNSTSCPEGMAFIPGGTFTMGSNSHYESEHSATDVSVDSFCIDRHEITNAEFRQFVEATGYQTIAERPLSKEQFPELTDDQ